MGATVQIRVPRAATRFSDEPVSADRPGTLAARTDRADRRERKEPVDSAATTTLASPVCENTYLNQSNHIIPRSFVVNTPANPVTASPSVWQTYLLRARRVYVHVSRVSLAR